jgi:hypothetical protein
MMTRRQNLATRNMAMMVMREEGETVTPTVLGLVPLVLDRLLLCLLLVIPLCSSISRLLLLLAILTVVVAVVGGALQRHHLFCVRSFHAVARVLLTIRTRRTRQNEVGVEAEARREAEAEVGREAEAKATIFGIVGVGVVVIQETGGEARVQAVHLIVIAAEAEAEAGSLQEEEEEIVGVEAEAAVAVEVVLCRPLGSVKREADGRDQEVSVPNVCNNILPERQLLFHAPRKESIQNRKRNKTS